MAQWETDTTFRCPPVAQSVWHARAGHPVFEYEFARAAAGREALGSTHAAETSHVFGTLTLGVLGVGPPAKATDVDWRISEVMQGYWSNFAKTGNPSRDRCRSSLDAKPKVTWASGPEPRSEFELSAFNQLLRRRCLPQPVLDLQSGHSLELGHVVGDADRSHGARVRGDQHVVRTDRRPLLSSATRIAA